MLPPRLLRQARPAGASIDVPRFWTPAREVRAMVTVLWIIAAILCVALCAYGITTAVRRGANRRAPGTQAPTQR